MIDVRKLLQEKEVFMGLDVCLKKLRSGGLTHIYLASNCPGTEEVQELAAVQGVPVDVLEVSNKELGALCKKPFAVSVICV